MLRRRCWSYRTGRAYGSDWSDGRFGGYRSNRSYRTGGRYGFNGTDRGHGRNRSDGSYRVYRSDRSHGPDRNCWAYGGDGANRTCGCDGIDWPNRSHGSHWSDGADRSDRSYGFVRNAHVRGRHHLRRRDDDHGRHLLRRAERELRRWNMVHRLETHARRSFCEWAGVHRSSVGRHNNLRRVGDRYRQPRSRRRNRVRRAGHRRSQRFGHAEGERDIGEEHDDHQTRRASRVGDKIA